MIQIVSLVGSLLILTAFSANQLGRMTAQPAAAASAAASPPSVETEGMRSHSSSASNSSGSMGPDLRR